MDTMYRFQSKVIVSLWSKASLRKKLPPEGTYFLVFGRELLKIFIELSGCPVFVRFDPFLDTQVPRVKNSVQFHHGKHQKQGFDLPGIVNLPWAHLSTSFCSPLQVWLSRMGEMRCRSVGSI